ncbi:hypothetical protein Mal4_15230 [Maioricimonas rarisocia]|uniref:Secreted protein n=1 Tax=Maioricimonas rarisocia TaxID=2528026 RepID=A0A517Z405_9PLAN|nr:hypothetical protein [Maioricimonas rarisocia]QDU37214.1 hypothetical protein Mal4_15230 [Maioricimonas rarisocia]
MRYGFSRTQHHSERRRRLAALLLLMVYATATVGLPATNDFAAPTTGCRCGDDLKQSGNCCCRNRARTSETGSCCKATVEASCCADSNSESVAAKPRPSAEHNCGDGGAKNPSLTVCSCGGEPISGLVCINDPRMLQHSCRPTPLDGASRFAPPASEQFTPGTRTPDTPPPESLMT